MSVDYSVAVINSRLQQVVNATDAGVGPGVLRLLDSVGGTLSSLALSKPSGTVSNGVIQFLGLSLIDPAAAAGGFAVAARVEDSAGTTIYSGLSVGTSTASEVILSPTNLITAGETIAITAATITGH